MKLQMVGLALLALLNATQERPPDAAVAKLETGDRFIGEWKLDTERSSRTGIESEVVKIENSGGEYKLAYDWAAENGTVLHWWIVTDMKGGCVKQTQTNGKPMTSQSCITRLGPDRFIDDTFLIKDEYEVSKNGQTLTIHRTFKMSPNGRQLPKSKLVFARVA